MNSALSQFEVNLESARQLGVIYEAFAPDLTQAVPLDELLRAEIVLVVSALDCYVHDVVRIRMAALLSKPADHSDAFRKFGVSMDFVTNALAASTLAERAALFEQEIRRLHGFRTFQRADSIAEALGLIGIQQLWIKIGTEMGAPPGDIRTRLNLVIDRRNRIAHEGDIDPTAGFPLKYPIDLVTTRGAADFIESVVTAMHSVVMAESTP